jgi:type IV secretion system protein VirB2
MRRSLAIAIAAAALAAEARAQAAGTPAGASPLVAALGWIQDTMLGNLATTAAVIAVAAVGFLMLTGRIDWRRGLTVVVGCFVIFGAAAIVAGLRAVASGAH